jgi:hypothetical protein
MQLPFHLVDMPVAVGVDQAPDQVFWMSLSNQILPSSEFDFAFMLATRSVLRKQTRPMLPVGGHFYASLFGSEPNRFVSTRDNHVARYLVHNFRVLQIADNSQSINTSGMKGEAAVSEVDP